MQWIKCHICRTKRPKKLAHEHHKHPKGAGGSNEVSNLCFLCADCHNSLHRLAELIEKGSLGKAQDLADVACKTPLSRKRMLKLAKVAATAFLNPTTSGNVKVQVTLPREVIEQLKVYASECRTETGRFMGVSRYIGEIVMAHLNYKEHSNS